jgi:hypothetical protein
VMKPRCKRAFRPEFLKPGGRHRRVPSAGGLREWSESLRLQLRAHWRKKLADHGPAPPGNGRRRGASWGHARARPVYGARPLRRPHPAPSWKETLRCAMLARTSREGGIIRVHRGSWRPSRGVTPDQPETALVQLVQRWGPRPAHIRAGSWLANATLTPPTPVVDIIDSALREELCAVTQPRTGAGIPPARAVHQFHRQPGSHSLDARKTPLTAPGAHSIRPSGDCGPLQRVGGAVWTPACFRFAVPSVCICSGVLVAFAPATRCRQFQLGTVETNPSERHRHAVAVRRQGESPRERPLPVRRRIRVTDSCPTGTSNILPRAGVKPFRAHRRHGRRRHRRPRATRSRAPRFACTGQGHGARSASSYAA